MSTPNQIPRITGKDIIAHVNISTANANYDGTGTIAGLLVASPESGNVPRLHIAAVGDTSLGSIRVFLRDSDIATWRFWDEHIVLARDVSGSGDLPYVNNYTFVASLPFPSPWRIGVATKIADEFNIFAMASSYGAT